MTSVRGDDLTEIAAAIRASVMPLARELRRADDDFTPTQLSVLGAIHRNEPITLGDLAARERLSPAMISRVVGKLVDAGMVDRTGDDADRRVCRVSISVEGNRWIERGRARRNAWLRDRLERLGSRDIDTLRNAVPLLERLTLDDG